jgi:hypothetical protein
MKCGIDNWRDVSEFVGGDKSPKQCEEHYYSFLYRSRIENCPNKDEFICIERDEATFQPIICPEKEILCNSKLN